MIEIDAARLRGQPVPAVSRELRHLGLIVHVRWRPTDREPPGLVLSVRPGGRVPAGSVVVVLGARPPGAATGPTAPARPGHHHGPRARPIPAPAPPPAQARQIAHTPALARSQRADLAQPAAHLHVPEPAADDLSPDEPPGRPPCRMNGDIQGS